LIVLHAGTGSEGLIDGCDLVFQAKSKDGDYHQEMNNFVFLEWFENQLMPALKALCNKQVEFKALVISKSFISFLIGCVRRPTPRTDKGSSSITDNPTDHSTKVWS
jgi:hypothetical protein